MSTARISTVEIIRSRRDYGQRPRATWLRNLVKIALRAMGFEVIGTITGVEIIAVGRGIRIASQLKKRYGMARWRKLKGTGRVRLSDGTVRVVELHWFQAHGIGKKKIRIKRFLD